AYRRRGADCGEYFPVLFNEWGDCRHLNRRGA
ncbi:hypothetical protein AZZ62_002810, partial [Klebsiella variicola]